MCLPYWAIGNNGSDHHYRDGLGLLIGLPVGAKRCRDRRRNLVPGAATTLVVGNAAATLAALITAPGPATSAASSGAAIRYDICTSRSLIHVTPSEPPQRRWPPQNWPEPTPDKILPRHRKTGYRGRRSRIRHARGDQDTYAFRCLAMRLEIF
jgi:hypothetical protein